MSDLIAIVEAMLHITARMPTQVGPKEDINHVTLSNLTLRSYLGILNNDSFQLNLLVHGKRVGFRHVLLSL
jgi:hypothetical protein